MNPYDFARVDWSRPPERRLPIWHHRLTAQQQLYTGHLDVTIYTETPNDSGVAGVLATVDPATGILTPFAVGLGKPTGMVFVPGS